MSAPVGATGGIISCSQPGESSYEKGAVPAPLRGRSGATFGWSRSFLVFDDGNDVTLQKLALVATSDLFVDRFTITLGAGALLSGDLEERRFDHEIGPGWIGSASVSWRILDDEDALPYIVFSGTLAATGTSTRLDASETTAAKRGRYIGIDGRFGATVGKTLADTFSPYVAARVFGGPVLWTIDDETRLGTDQYHVQLALGAVVLLPAGFDLFAEGAPLGEQGVFGGFGLRY